MTSKLLLKVILIFLLSLSACSTYEEADLVLMNGKIITVDDNLTEAEAIAVKNDSIIQIGSNELVKNFIGRNTKVIKLHGKTAVPGFIESHAHFYELGISKIRLDLTTANNWDEIVYMVARAVAEAKPGEWIVGRGWHQDKFDPKPIPSVQGYPVHSILSKASPFNPVMLTHASGHAAFANAKAMELAGIDTSTPDPQGGKIVRDSLGNAIGVFEETAELLISSLFEEHQEQRTQKEINNEIIKAYKLAEKECFENGITSFHDAGSTFDNIDLLKKLYDNNELNIRLNVMLLEPNENLKRKISDYKLIGYDDNKLTVRSIKKYMDGALGSRGAWLIAPYDDLEDHFGQNITPINDIKETAEIAIENGFQLCTHAIGDKANRVTLNIYEEIFNTNPGKKDLRWRIEHSQHISNKDIPRFAKLGVIAAMQTVHCTSDAVFVEKRLGKKRAREGAYSWRKLIDSGAIICNGTDAPVEDVSPLASFYSAVTRKLEDGSTFYPEQKMNRIEALKSYTINGAYAEFAEELKGSLEIGKFADITVLSNDILTCSEEEILNTEILYTIVGGKIVYQKIE
ncbi:MAG: amidohydrolase [Ignavibacteria bacterium]|jgi:predicted amidohydrolase YtcJ